jgi:hypothetical protein
MYLTKGYPKWDSLFCYRIYSVHNKYLIQSGLNDKNQLIIFQNMTLVSL